MSPAVTSTFPTFPAVLAVMTYSIFIDSVTSSVTGDGDATGLSAFRLVTNLPGFWASYWFSVYVALGGTTLAAVGAVVLGHGWCRRPRSRR